MSMIDQAPDIVNERYLDDVLLWRPPLPIGKVDLSPFEVFLVDASDQEPGYAWERMPRWLTKIDDIFKNPSLKSLVHFDLGSSLPINVEMMRALAFKRSAERSHDVVGNLFSIPPGEYLEDPLFNAVSQTVARQTPARQLLESAVQKVMYTINSEDEADGDREVATRRMHARLSETLLLQDEVYTIERNTEDIETKWQIKFSIEKKPQSYLEYLADTPCRSPLAEEAIERIRTTSPDQQISEDDKKHAKDKEPLGRERAQRYLDWQVGVLASMISGNDRYRPARFVSIDQTPPDDIAYSSLNNTPESTRSMDMFSRAITSLYDRNQHLIGNILEPLPAPDNSLALITCYDAWPFYSSYEGMNNEDIEVSKMMAVHVIMGWYQKLNFGGKIVIFPWAIKDDPTALNGITAHLSLLMGHSVSKSEFHHATLQDIMSESDLIAAEKLSGIFIAGNISIEALIIEKPSRKLVQRHAGALGRRIVIAANATQELTDPTQ